MTAFALDLDHDGIRLLERVDGAWSELARVALDDPALPKRMRALAAMAADRAGGEFETELIIPPSQILYTTLSGTAPEDGAVRRAMDGLTPCPIEDLVFDWRRVPDGIRVAAVDRTTLDEAEEFATTYGLNPTRFTARPATADFPDLPDFGATEAARLGYGETPLPVFASGRDAVGAEAEDESPEEAAGNIFAEDAEAPGDEEQGAPERETEDADEPAPEDAGEEAAPIAGEVADGTAGDAPDTHDAPKAEAEDETGVGDAVAPEAAEENIAASAVPEAPPPPVADPEPGEALEPVRAAPVAPPAGGFASTRADAPASRPEPRQPPPPVPPPAPPVRAPQRTPRPDPAPPPPVDWRRVGIVGGGTLASLAALVWIALSLVTPDTDPRPAPPEPEEAVESLALPALPGPGAVPEVGPGLAPFAPREWAAAPRAAEPDNLPDLRAMEARRIPPGAEAGARTAEREIQPPGDIRAADVWQTPPPPGPDPAGETLDDLYLASLDPIVQVDDAFALAAMSADPDLVPLVRPAPDPSRVFDHDERGLVRATPEGAETPDGVIVTLGRPPLAPPARPVTAVFVPDPEAALALAGKRPRNRPDDLMERVERDLLGGRTLAELRTIRARPRPESAQEIAAAQGDPEAAPSALAVEVSRAPNARPDGFATVVAAILANRAAQAPEEADEPVQVASAAAVAPRGPNIPTSASVARQATLENAIKLNRLNLIGVYGTPSNRRALVRLPSGRYQKVQVGDKLDGGRIDAIGDGELRYTKGGRNVVLRVPSG